MLRAEQKIQQIRAEAEEAINKKYEKEGGLEPGKEEKTDPIEEATTVVGEGHANPERALRKQKR